MSQHIAHYRVDWDRFCTRWAEEENPLDALEGFPRESTADDNYKSVMGCLELYSRFARNATLREWSAALDAVVSAFCNQGGPDAICDLADDFAHEEGGFTVTMAPDRVAAIVRQWQSLPLEAVQDVLAGAMGADDARFVMAILSSRAALLIKAADAGQGYVNRLG